MAGTNANASMFGPILKSASCILFNPTSPLFHLDQLSLQPKLNKFATIIWYIIFAEFLRRCVLILLTAFTGPLAKIPGPFMYKIIQIKWIYQVSQGIHLKTGPDLFKTYGDVVRVGKCVRDINHIWRLTLPFSHRPKGCHVRRQR